MYSIQFFKGRARECQVQANIDNCTAYLQAGFNISENVNDNYTSVAIGSNASDISRRWAKQYARLISDDFNTPLAGKDGILIGGANGENELDLIHLKMPAIFVKPLFATNPIHVDWIKTKSVQLRLARNLANSILSLFPNGGLIGFCLTGTDHENDQDRILFGGVNAAQYSDMVLRQAAIMLQSNAELLAMPEYQVDAI